MDHLAFSFKGYRAVSLYTASKKALSIHTSRDNTNLLDQGQIRKAGQVLERTIRILDRKNIPIKVNAYAGYRGEELPRSFVYGKKRHEIIEILSMTMEESKERRRGRKFLIKTKEGKRVTLFYEEKSREWSLLSQ